jgi:hypothetical protein
MTEAKWKKVEREVAAIVGGVRVPNVGKAAPDVICRGWCIEVKLRSRPPYGWSGASARRRRRQRRGAWRLCW